jgi:polar amino acid transport system substrate-binding protein
MNALRTRVLTIGIALLAVTAAGCASNTGPVNLASTGKADVVEPGHVKMGKAALPPPAASTPGCSNPTASLRPPSPMPAPGHMPAGSTMAQIQAEGHLTVGVDQNTFLFGYRNPKTNNLEGFDIQMARDVAQAIFGDPDKIVFKAINSLQRTTVLEPGHPVSKDGVDLVVRTFTINCDRLQTVAFSTVYYQAQRRVLVQANSPVRSIADLGGKRVCATTGSDSLSQGQDGAKPPIPVAVDDWSDCLVMLQQNQVDAVSTDDTILAGMHAQDPNTKIVGAPIAPEPYGIAMRKADPDFVAFVNGVLQQVRTDGEWTKTYNQWLSGALGPAPAPPQPTYSN